MMQLMGLVNMVLAGIALVFVFIMSLVNLSSPAQPNPANVIAGFFHGMSTPGMWFCTAAILYTVSTVALEKRDANRPLYEEVDDEDDVDPPPSRPPADAR
jgi:hypothetical protein